ncbi:fibroblast growth factor receptor 4-like [Oculina patagonica]
MIKNAKTTPLGGTLYKCQMSYRGKTSIYQPRLVVMSGLSAPTITLLNPSIIVEEPNKVKETCKASGFPVAKITWLQNGKQMSTCLKTVSNSCAGQNYQVIEENNEDIASSKSRLIIVSTKFPRDHGNYTCVATNSEGRGQKTMEVSIYSLPKFDKTKSFWITNQIYCQVSETNPLPKITWQHQTGLCLNINPECKPDDNRWRDITSSANFVISPGVDVATAKSTLTMPKDAPSAFFRCLARNARGSSVNSAMSFFASGMDRIKITTSQVEYDEDQTLKVRCVAVCKGTMIGWYKDGQQLSAADPRVNITWAAENDRTWTNLVVERLAVNDSGTYTCRARDCISNQPMNDSKRITVKKVFPPSILAFHNQTVYRKTVANLHCEISANPVPSVQWYKDNHSLEGEIGELHRLVSCDSLVQGFYRVKSEVGRLVICKPENALHTGFYTCIAANRRGETNATAFLDVLEDPVIVNPNKESQTLSVKLGKPWNITCQATGNPVPTVEWKRENGNKSMSPKEHSSKGAVLSIDSVSEDDFGVYFCVAVNSKNVAYAYVKLVSADPPPSEQPPQGLKQEIIIALSVVGGLLFLFVIMAIVCCAFFHHQRQQIKEYRSQFFPYFDGHHEIDLNRTLHEQCDNLAYDPVWEFPEERLVLGEVLGSGAFGQVIKAEAIGISDFNPRDKSAENARRRSKRLRRSSSSRMYQDSKGVPYVKTTVAVKTLKVGATATEFKDLASELKILIHVGEHKNIVNLLGACTKGDRLLIIMEYAPYGNLLKFLRGKREIYEPTWVTTTNNPEVELTITNLVVFAYQVSRGMEFLASRKCIHRDLATRNVLVGEDYVIKVADFGLARDVYKSDMYVKATSAGVLPVKWMALESLFDRLYTEKSDVWSFGICLWEIFTLGGTPYPGIPTEQLLDFLSDGHRMEQPHNCPLDMYTIMRDCWEKDADRRPTFALLSERIGRILELHTSKQTSSAYISLSEENRPTRPRHDYYMDPVDSGSTLTHTGYAGLNRQSSEDIANSPLPALPRDVEAEQELEPDERQRMLEPAANGSLSGNESGIGLDDAADEMLAAELRPLQDASRFAPNFTGKGKKKTKSKESVV